MDAPARWLRVEWPMTTMMLELLLASSIAGAMVLVAIQSNRHLQQRVQMLDGLSLGAGPKVAMMEYRAMTGMWPLSNEAAGYIAAPARGQGRVRSMSIRANGAVDITFSNYAAEMEGKILTLRAWQGLDPGLPVAWSCGRSSAAPLTPHATDRTTLRDDQLLSPCRGRP